MVMEVPEPICPQNSTWHHEVPLSLRCPHTGWKLWVVHLPFTTSGATNMKGLEALVCWRHMKAEDAGCPLDKWHPEKPAEIVPRKQSMTCPDIQRAAFSHGLPQVWLPGHGRKRGENRGEHIMLLFQACLGEENWLMMVWKKKPSEINSKFLGHLTEI